MTNLKVIEAFLRGERAHSQNLSSNGTDLVNYSTTIARHQMYEGRRETVVATKKYSNTTSVIQNLLRPMVPADLIRPCYEIDQNNVIQWWREKPQTV